MDYFEAMHHPDRNVVCTLKDAASRLGVSYSALDERARAGKLDAPWSGGVRLVAVADVLDCLVRYPLQEHMRRANAGDGS